MRAVVIGGGISGLVAARRLALAGHDVTLYEKSSDLGGLISAAEIGGHSIDVGAEAFAVARPATLNLIADLGLRELLIEPAVAEARIRHDGRTFKIPHGVLGVPSDLADPALLEAIGPQAVAEAVARDAEPWQLESAGTVEELVKIRLGGAVLELLVAPVLAGVHASSPHLLEIDAVAPGLFGKAKELGSLVAAAKALRAGAARPGAAVMGLNGGMVTLVQALAASLASLGVEVQTEAPVRRATGADFDWKIELESGAQTQTQLLVVATPPKIAATILTEIPAISEPLSKIESVDVTVVALEIASPILDSAPLGSGVLVAPGDPRVQAKASTHTTAKWAFQAEAFGIGRHLVRLSYGRDGQAPPPSEDLLATARTDAALLYGVAETEIEAAVIQAWPQSLIQAKTGHLGLAQAIAREQSEYRSLALVGAGLGGNGITGILATANAQFERIGI